ncbi:MAG TPA: Cro/CI family transcriptional regulator [Chloroflexota bacterium]|nr:Cro/CI family transcriptional regulator [Chloroflexota bacterium]
MNAAAHVIEQFGSQSALARALGINQSTVQHWAKKGQIPSWRYDQILAAARELGIPLERRELLGDSEMADTAGLDNGRVTPRVRGPHASERLLPPRSGPAFTFMAGARSSGQPAAPVGGPPGPAHGRADWIPDQEQEIGALREEIREVRDVLQQLVEEVAHLRRERAATAPDEASDADQERPESS